MKWAILIYKYLPSVLAGVAAVEQSVAAKEPGATKKQIVLDAIQAGAKVGEAVSHEDVAAISTLVDSTVTTLNTSKAFGFGK